MIEKILSANIKIKTKNSEDLKKQLDLEMSRKKYSRSESEIIVDKEILTIKIFSEDIVALKATVNNYINILELIKKIYEVEL
jgi:tRNA threonylcarbamoyladenosine modification (KEOPS) complex  Pcc1 subunit